MATIRIVATVCAALFAGLTLTLGSAALVPAAAQTAAEARPGRPLNLLPNLGKATKFTKQTRKPARAAQTKSTVRRVAQRSAAPARALVRRQNARAVASRQDDRSVTPDQDSLGYQVEGTTQPPIDAWLRSPLPTAAAPAVRAVRPPAAASRDRLDTTAATVSTETISADTVTAGTAIPDATPVTTTADFSTTESFKVADAGEINEIDLAATETPAPADKSWMHGLLAMLAGAFAAAAVARFLFARGGELKLRRA